MDKCVLQTASSGTEMAAALLSRSLFEGSVGNGRNCVCNYAFSRPNEALHAIVNLLSIAETHRAVHMGKVYLLEEILMKSIDEGLQFSVSDTASPRGLPDLRKKADKAARLLISNEGLAEYVSRAFTVREPFTALEKANLEKALADVLARVDMAKSLLGAERG